MKRLTLHFQHQSKVHTDFNVYTLHFGKDYVGNVLIPAQSDSKIRGTILDFQKQFLTTYAFTTTILVEAPTPEAAKQRFFDMKQANADLSWFVYHMKEEHTDQDFPIDDLN